MREVPGFAALDPHDVAAPQLVQRAHHDVFLQIADLRDEVERERAADRRRDLGDVPGGVVEPRQPRRDDRLHARRSRLLVRVAAERHASLFDDEQRVAFGETEGPRLRVRVERMLRDLVGEDRKSVV